MEKNSMEEKSNVVAGVEFNPPPLTGEAAIKEKITAAQVAMAGPERVAEWEQEERSKVAKTEQEELEKKLAKLAEQKEALELSWITADDKKKQLFANLKPLLEEEKKIEEEEARTEIEEAKTASPSEKKTFEEKRWQIQSKRHSLEEKKWKLEIGIGEIEKTIDVATKEYRGLLNEEDALKAKLKEVEKNLTSNA